MKTILFICIHNSGRSQMAEAFFNHLAGGRAKAISAGSQPGDRVNPVAVKVMLESGIDISKNKPKLLTAEMMQGIDLAIIMGCQDACPYAPVETRDWGLEDPQGKSIKKVRQIRDEIKTRVAELVKEMIDK